MPFDQITRQTVIDKYHYCCSIPFVVLGKSSVVLGWNLPNDLCKRINNENSVLLGGK